MGATELRPTPIADAIAARVRKMRRDREWSQADLAIKAGLTRDQIVNFETRRKRAISVDEMASIATAFECQPSALWPTLDRE